ncbi:MAG: substrate-binding domain-containing protein, partial [Oscillospiraceae bacterium]
YVQRGNPKGIRGLGDLRRADVTMVNRERGSGERVLLDEKLKAMGLPPQEVNGYRNEQTASLTVAAAVARGEGDMGLGAEAACLQVPGVDFIPLQKEWCDMVFLAEREREPAFQAILDYVLSEAFVRDLSQSADYDLSQTGKVFRL